MVLEPTLDKKLKSDKPNYKLRSVYQKNGLLHIKFETKFKVHRGTFKINKLMINPETRREYFFDEIEKAVKKIYDTEANNKKYVESVSKNIDKIFEIK